MTDCTIDHSDYRNNGLITKIWGQPGWIFNHAVTFSYPLKPTSEQKAKYRNYFIALGDVLPCRYCRESYQKLITHGITALTDDVLESRETLTKWFYQVHEAVNNKLEINYGLTYDDVVDRYESFRARCGKPNITEKGCTVPLDYKAFSFKKLYYFDAPIVSLDKIKNFITIAKIRKINLIQFDFIELAQILNGDFDKLKQQPCWIYRNKFCQHMIKYMRQNAIPSIEESGIWYGTPTIDELYLLMFLSSNLNQSEINQAIQKIEEKIEIINKYGSV